MVTITAGIPEKDGCPVLTRVKAFIIDEQTRPRLQHVVRNGAGVPVDLATLLASASEVSDSSSATPLSVRVRVMEVTVSNNRRPIAYDGEVADEANGVITVDLTTAVTGQSGLYNAAWAVCSGDEILRVDNTIISVEANLFGAGNGRTTHKRRCPTLGEIRMRLADSSPAENVLLNDLEFADEQIVQALVQPIRYFNEQSPAGLRCYDTTSFPWREAWIDAAIGYLYQYAAAHYRRNRLGGAAGGVQVDDLNKEAEYLRIAQMHHQRWTQFVSVKKVELNIEGGYGVIQ